MSLHGPPDHQFPLGHNELDSLEDVRKSLAGDVVEILTAVTRTTLSDTPFQDQPGSGSEDRQALLRAAIVDLEALDKRLHHARH